MTFHFEGKKHAYRQTQDGIVISFTCHPSDVSAELATAALGTRYMVAVAEIGDDERSIGRKSGEVTTDDPEAGVEALATAGHPSAIAGAVQFRVPATNSKDRRPFASLPLSQQAGMRCNDAVFQEFVAVQTNAVTGGPEAAAGFVRDRCGVKSRSELDDGGNQFQRGAWRCLEGDYQAWLTDRQYAGAVR